MNNVMVGVNDYSFPDNAVVDDTGMWVNFFTQLAIKEIDSSIHDDISVHIGGGSVLEIRMCQLLSSVTHSTRSYLNGEPVDADRYWNIVSNDLKERELYHTMCMDLLSDNEVNEE